MGLRIDHKAGVPPRLGTISSGSTRMARGLSDFGRGEEEAGKSRRIEFEFRILAKKIENQSSPLKRAGEKLPPRHFEELACLDGCRPHLQ